MNNELKAMNHLPRHRRLFKPFEFADLIPYIIALLMLAGDVYFVLRIGFLAFFAA